MIQMKRNCRYFVAAALLCVFITSPLVSSDELEEDKVTVAKPDGPSDNIEYEVWGADQSNSDPSATAKGTSGSFLWIWDSKSIKKQLKGKSDAVPLSCTLDSSAGPCDLNDIFSSDLEEYDATGPTGSTLGDLMGFGRLHGILQDPQNKYVTANIFAPSGGYVGVIDTATKEAIALFRVTKMSLSDGATVTRSVHLSLFTDDGSAIIVGNLHGRTVERIDLTRNHQGTITALQFNTDASIGLGKGMSVDAEATYFVGNNAFGNPLLGSVIGNYLSADFGDLTPNGICKESGCAAGVEPQGGGRPTNVPIYTTPSTNGNCYVTLGGGGLFVLKHDTTPMSIVGEYGNAVINGAGVVAGPQVDDQVYFDTGVSASGAGFDQSAFALYSLDDTKFTSAMPQNTPMPTQIFKDSSNTNTGGNLGGTSSTNDSGQIPGTTTRRDAHGIAATLNGKYIHVVDRIQNVVEVFDTKTHARTTYDLVSKDGISGKEGAAGPCFTRSVLDDAGLPLNDPAPDLMDITPDGKFLMIAFRGPAPVSVPHSAQGSCPGVGIVRLTNGGKSGRLMDVLRSYNSVDTSSPGTMSGGRDYTGNEHSDMHNAIVIRK